MEKSSNFSACCIVRRVKIILRYFLDLCLLRASPEALPASWILFWLLLPLQMLVNIILVGESLGGLDKAFLASVLDIGVLLAVLWLCLRFMGHLARFQQAATALLGCGSLIGLILLPVQWVAGQQLGEEAGSGAEVLAVLLILITIWSAVVSGNIFRHALGVRLGLGVALALMTVMLSTLFISVIFPLPIPASQ